MKLRVIASSSDGNCYLLESGDEALMLECGIRFKDIQIALGFDFSKVKGCLVSHSHNDHSQATMDLLKMGINVYSSRGTIDALGLDHFSIHQIRVGEQFEIGHFVVMPFETQHDAAESLGFIIFHSGAREKLIFLTDSYYSKYRFSGVNYFLVECNYCLDILKANVEAGIIPEVLAKRTLVSHFSLDHCKDFLKVNSTTDTRKIVLLHLSDDNSDEKRMVREVSEATGIDTVAAAAGLNIDLALYPF